MPCNIQLQNTYIITYIYITIPHTSQKIPDDCTDNKVFYNFFIINVVSCSLFFTKYTFQHTYQHAL